VARKSSSARRARWRHIIGIVLSVLLFAGAVLVLRAELRQQSVHEILDELRGFKRIRLAMALGATVLGYLAFAGYDAVSLAYLNRRLPLHYIAYAAFLGYAFANSLPFSVVTGGAVRYRLYSDWGIGREQAARVVTLNTVTYVVGLLAAAGVAFAIQPVQLPGFMHLPVQTVRPLGFACLILVAAYLAWSTRTDGPLQIWRWELPRPTLRRALVQIGVSSADWIFSGLALYALLPGRVPFHVFFAVFLLGQIAALVAQVPGGLGVFEAVMLWSLTPAIRPPTMLIALAGYRIVYFLLPLLLAATVWGIHEARRWHRGHRRAVPGRASAR
jgi:uncharacterized membrane protein YbhN (UPF0104 family)